MELRKYTDEEINLTRRSSAKKALGPVICRKNFLKNFPNGFYDETYLSWERDYKFNAHQKWNELLSPKEFKNLIQNQNYGEIANRAVRIESRTNLLFSFEKMALRDGLKTTSGAEAFAKGLYQLLHSHTKLETRFNKWCDAVESLPRRQTRVLTWPIVTVFAFMAQPQIYAYLKPNVTKTAALKYDYDFQYQSKPNWEGYAHYLQFCEVVKQDLKDLRPRDLIDIQSFLWVQGSDEY